MRLRVLWRLSLLEFLRNRVVLLLFTAVPAALLGLVVLTADHATFLGFQLPATLSAETLFATPRDVTLVFTGIASVGLLGSFVGMGMMQRDGDTHRRLVLAGFPQGLFLAGRLLALTTVVAGTATGVGAVVAGLIGPRFAVGLVTGLLLAGWVQGCLGLLVGTLLRGELEGVLVISMLVVVDAGWLQNPAYYAGASRTTLLHLLPAYLPSQVCLAAAFSDLPFGDVAWKALAYGVGLLAVSGLLGRGMHARGATHRNR